MLTPCTCTAWHAFMHACSNVHTYTHACMQVCLQLHKYITHAYVQIINNIVIVHIIIVQCNQHRKFFNLIDGYPVRTTNISGSTFLLEGPFMVQPFSHHCKCSNNMVCICIITISMHHIIF
jgi:hypothetical protein